MIVGEIYKVTHKWLLPFSQGKDWKDCGPVLYLGEDVLTWEDGTKIVNHVLFVDGENRIVDSHFLKHLSVLDENR